jgi:chemotaxis protein CheD
VAIPPETPSSPTSDRRFFSGAIGMGEIGSAHDTGVLRTFVGSCVGVALYNRRLKIACLAHIMLPESKGRSSQPGKFADTAIPEMLRQLKQLSHGQTVRWSAKMAGGAKMFAFQSGMTVGEQNILAVEQILGNLDIPLLGRCCGGTQGRRIALDVATGTMTIETMGGNPETI